MKKRTLLLGTLFGIMITEQTFPRVSFGFGVDTGPRRYHRGYRRYRKPRVGFGIGFGAYPSHWNTGFYVGLGIPGYARSARWDRVVCLLEDKLEALNQELEDAEDAEDYERSDAIRRDIDRVRSDLNWLESRGYYCT